jgi:hypothetical protein
MVRWFLFASAFSVFVAGMFFNYLWLYRVEFAQVAFKRSVPHHMVLIEDIRIINPTTVQAKNISFFTDRGIPVFSAASATLLASPLSWLSYLLLPSSHKLHLQSVVFQTQTLSVPELPFTADAIILEE